MSEQQTSALPGIESFVIDDAGLGAALRISIARPMGGADAAGGGEISVVFLTDADYAFGTAVEAARIGQYAGEVGPVAIVGIGYAEESGDHAFVGARRGLDLYRGPRRSMEIPGAGTLEFGGADAFLAAILDKVAPEVERRLPQAAGARHLLFGMSAGGHFAAHVLARKPCAFAGYALMSPALVDFPPVPGAEQLVEAVRALPPGSIPDGTAVFLSAGSREEEPGEPLAAASIIGNLYRMRAALSAQGAATTLCLFEGETHISVLGAAVTRAIHTLVPAPGAPSWQDALTASE